MTSSFPILPKLMPPAALIAKMRQKKSPVFLAGLLPRTSINTENRTASDKQKAIKGKL